MVCLTQPPFSFILPTCVRKRRKRKTRYAAFRLMPPLKNSYIKACPSPSFFLNTSSTAHFLFSISLSLLPFFCFYYHHSLFVSSSPIEDIHHLSLSLIPSYPLLSCTHTHTLTHSQTHSPLSTLSFYRTSKDFLSFFNHTSWLFLFHIIPVFFLPPSASLTLLPRSPSLCHTYPFRRFLFFYSLDCAPSLFDLHLYIRTHRSPLSSPPLTTVSHHLQQKKISCFV